MHDAKGRPLVVGDRVMIPCVVTQIHASVDYCNVNLEFLATMPGSTTPSSTGAVNTQQVLRANEGDDLSFIVVRDKAISKLQ